MVAFGYSIFMARGEIVALCQSISTPGCLGIDSLFLDSALLAELIFFPMGGIDSGFGKREESVPENIKIETLVKS
jgi:hypothetical protein